MHKAIPILARVCGVTVEERNCLGGHVFDGRSIGTYYSKCVWNERLNDYVPTPKIVRFTDHDLLHEVFHYLLADPAQRDLPEYGLGEVYIPGHPLESVPVVVDRAAADSQEIATQYCCAWFGELFDIEVALSGDAARAVPCSWAAYTAWKAGHHQTLGYSAEHLAVIRGKARKAYDHVLAAIARGEFASC